MKTVRCDYCGNEYGIGDWPLCPHERPLAYFPFKPYWDHHVAPEPVFVDSLAKRKKLMRQNSCDYRGKKVGQPGCEV